uniref:Uncharacterized protein n=1 Tax=Hyaloperonospora arabidopsidis (strain Emoy2) TaxID=559515 RepID=M4B557_HYAAE
MGLLTNAKNDTFEEWDLNPGELAYGIRIACWLFFRGRQLLHAARLWAKQVALKLLRP